MATIRITRDGAGASRLSATCRSLGVRLGWWVGTSGSPACYATRLKLDALSFNPHFPVNTLQLMRGAVAAEAEGALAAYVEGVFQHMWERPKKMDDPEVIRVALTESGLDAEHLLVRAQDQRVKDALAASTQRASSAAPSASRRSSSAARCSSARTGCATWRRRSHARPRDHRRSLYRV